MQLITKLIKKIFTSIIQRATDQNMKTSWDIYKDYVKIHPTTIIDPSASIKIFNPPDPPEICLEIGGESHIFSTFNLLRPQAKIKIGKRCQLGASNFICAESIEVGDDVLMAWGVTVMDNDSHPIEWNYRINDVKNCYNDYLTDKNNFIKNKDWSHVGIKPIIIGDKTWIGFNASVLKGTKIGENAILSANSFITKNIPPNSIATGNPARITRKIKVK